jgi:DNA primase
MQKSFVKEAAEALYVDDRTIKEDLSRLLLKLEEMQQEIIAEATKTTKSKPVELSDAEQKAALELLKDPS